VYLLVGYNGTPRFLAHARAAGVEHVVLQSTSLVPLGDVSNAFAAYHIEAEEAVRESGLAWTFTQSNSFMTNTYQWLPQLRAGDVVRVGFADIPEAMIDPFDITAVAVSAFNSSEHRGRSYHLTGPESLLPAERLRVLGDALGRPLQLVALSNDEAREELSKSLPPEFVDAFISIFADGNHDLSRVLPTVQDVTGRPAHSRSGSQPTLTRSIECLTARLQGRFTCGPVNCCSPGESRFLRLLATARRPWFPLRSGTRLTPPARTLASAPPAGLPADEGKLSSTSRPS
jgi:hypothetical protein